MPVKKIFYTTVRLDSEIVNKYRKISKKNLIPVSRLIERAMENSLKVFEELADQFSSDFDKLSIELTGKKLVRK